MGQPNNAETAVLKAAERWGRARQAAAEENDRGQLLTAQEALINAVKGWRASRTGTAGVRQRPGGAMAR